MVGVGVYMDHIWMCMCVECCFMWIDGWDGDGVVGVDEVDG